MEFKWIINSGVLDFLSFFLLLAKKLAEELDGWLRASGLSKSPDVRGVIAP